LAGRYKSLYSFTSLWTVETDHHLRCYNLDNFKLEQDIDIRKLCNMDDKIKNIDLFEMGYPYMLQVYNNYIIISTDYGIYTVKA